ncbi:MAG: M24 family metallopeptidase [Anaerolineae bacterium]|jgi:Xaa-Pro aminopeptidase|nr:M24 family metallopeptidase [Anaerolineae bacterium]
MTSNEAAHIVQEKTSQAVDLLQAQGLDLWLTFVRETTQVKDPVLDLILGFHLTWTSALLVSRSGERIAIVGRYDVANVERLGAYTRVLGYDQSIQPQLLETLARLDPRAIGVNMSEHDPAADGLTHGMFQVLSRMLAGTPYGTRLVSAGHLIGELRGRKTASELALIRGAIESTEEAFQELAPRLRLGVSDIEVADFLHGYAAERGFGFAWEREYCPVVTVGPGSAVGHAMPAGLRAEAGSLIQVDFGLARQGFVADLQRTWYLRRPGETAAPEPVQRAWAAARAALEAGRAALKPGAKGWEVDAAARAVLVAAGYPEYLHAFGHHVGRTAHDGATVLGPQWERYGESINGVIQEGNVFAIELGVSVPGYGYIGCEENVVVTGSGAEYLSTPQEALWLV